MNIFLFIFAVLLFNLIVFIHEFGHFFTAKMFGVKVNEFAIGMGPKIFKFQRGETLYSLRAFPIGGFCDLEGDDSASDSSRSFLNIAPWKRIIIISAGAIMNMILGLVMTFILLAQQPMFLSTTVSRFADNSVSSQHGLMVGDTILSIDGSKITSNKDLAFRLSIDGKDNFTIGINRAGENITLDNVKFATEELEGGQKSTKVDFYIEHVDKTPWTLIKQSFLDTVSTVKIVWASFLGMITGRFSVGNMSGPIGVASVVGKVTNESLKVNVVYALNNIISIMALISVNLGIVNLFPIPALDGGKIVFLLFEIIRGKPVNPKYEGWVHAAGFALFILLTIVITFNDIVKIIRG